MYPTITCMPPVFIEHRLDIMTNVSRPRLKHSLSSVPEIPGPCTLGFKPDHSHKRFPSNPNKTSYCNGKASRLTRRTLTKTVSFLVTTIYFLELCYFESNISMILINKCKLAGWWFFLITIFYEAFYFLELYVSLLEVFQNKIKDQYMGCWRDGSVVKTTTALPEDPGSFPSTHMAAHTCL